MLIVKTKNGIETNTQDDFLNFDSKNTAQIKAFQNWMDIKHPNWVGATNADLSNGKNLNKGSGYGNYGASTQKANKRYGSEFDAMVGSTMGMFTPTQSSAPTTAEIANINAQLNDPTISAAKKEELKNKLTALYQKGKESGLFDVVGGFLKDKLGLGQTDTTYTQGGYGSGMPADYSTEKKGLSTGAIIGIVVGAAAVIGLIVYVSKEK